jgi:hypothetical protein
LINPLLIWRELFDGLVDQRVEIGDSLVFEDFIEQRPKCLIFPINRGRIILNIGLDVGGAIDKLLEAIGALGVICSNGVLSRLSMLQRALYLYPGRTCWSWVLEISSEMLRGKRCQP